MDWPFTIAWNTHFADEPSEDAASYGLIGDGLTDNTDAFRRLFASGSKRVVIPAGDYVAGSIEVPSNIHITLQPGTIIRNNGHLGPGDRFLNIRGSHVHIVANGARVVSSRDDYPTGGQRHGVYVFGASDVIIEGLESYGNGGDGFYIGGPAGHPATNISILSCIASGNRRQGLSITNARAVDVVDSSFMSTTGTPPQLGIDLEPNRPTDELAGIRLIRPQTGANEGGGISVRLSKLRLASPEVDVAILDHYSEEEEPAFGARDTFNTSGTIRYARSAADP